MGFFFEWSIYSGEFSDGSDFFGQAGYKKELRGVHNSFWGSYFS